MKRVMIALALAGCVAACSRASTPEAVIEEFMRASETGRCDSLPDMFTSDSRQMLGEKLKQSCRESADQRKAGKGEQRTLKSLAVLDRQEQGDKVTLRVQPTLSDNSTQPAMPFVLLRQDGRWRIDLMQTAAANGKNEGPGGPGAPQMPGARAPGANPAPPVATNTVTTTTNSTTTTEGEANESENSAE